MKYIIVWGMITIAFILGLSRCDTGTGGVNFQAPDTSGTDETGGDGSGGGTTAEYAADALGVTLNTSNPNNVTVNGNTVTVNQDLEVSPSANFSFVRVASSFTVPSFTIPDQVAFIVPDGKTVTVLNRGSITAVLGSTTRIGGTVAVEAGGNIKTLAGSTLAVQDGGRLEGEPGTVTVGGTLQVAEGAYVSETIIVTDTENITGGGKENLPPLLTETPRVNYAVNGTVSVMFTFTEAVTSLSAGITSAVNTITVTPQTQIPGTQMDLALTVLSPASGLENTFTVPVMPASGIFAPPSGGERTVARYSEGHGVVGLKNSGTDPEWLFVKEEDAPWRKLFNAIYAPNAVETTGGDNQALGLFVISFGANYEASNFFIKGSVLPDTAPGEPVIIHLGLPVETLETTDQTNEGLKFTIPIQGLGTAIGSYPHIRLRVNRGAQLVIEADNSGYSGGGAGNPCPTGFFNNGTVEVMAGGKLRDAAYEGFPLGSGAVIICHQGSSLAVGPELGNSDALSNAQVYNDYYSGWLIGPSGNQARIEWGTGDQNGNYIEVREDRLAFSANLTIKKTIGLMYSVWFVNEPTITIDTKNDGVTIRGKPGLFASGADYKFYGTASASGGQNPAYHKATIIVKQGSTLHGVFLTAGAGDMETLISAETGDIVITNGGSGTPEVYTDAITGYLNWNG
jgi:hypothetical protein